MSEMFDAQHVKCTAIIGDSLWALDHATGYAVVWDQRLVRFRIPTQEEQMGADAYNARKKAEREAKPAANQPKDSPNG